MKEAVAFVFGLGMVLNAALFVPQAIHLWRTKTSQGVSILSFAGFNTLQAIGSLHGYFQHDHECIQLAQAIFGSSQELGSQLVATE